MTEINKLGTTIFEQIILEQLSYAYGKWRGKKKKKTLTKWKKGEEMNRETKCVRYKREYNI